MSPYSFLDNLFQKCFAIARLLGLRDWPKFIVSRFLDSCFNCDTTLVHLFCRVNREGGSFVFSYHFWLLHPTFAPFSQPIPGYWVARTKEYLTFFQPECTLIHLVITIPCYWDPELLFFYLYLCLLFSVVAAGNKNKQVSRLGEEIVTLKRH